jgi:hypothetical protein
MSWLALHAAFRLHVPPSPWSCCCQVVGTTHASSDVRRLVRAVTRGLRCCQEPDAAETGLGGTYFFRSEAGAHVAIVKPCDEEPLAPNNPKVQCFPWRFVNSGQ